MKRNPFTLIKKNSDLSDIIRYMNIFFDKELDCDIPPYSEIRRNNIPLLRRIYSEILLYSSIVCPHRLPSVIPDELKKSPVFGDGTPTLQELLETAGSVAVFPTFSETAPPEKWRLYVFQRKEKDSLPDHADLLEHNHIIDTYTAVYLVDKSFQNPNPMIQGKSWQLAYRMAQYALEQKNEIKKALAYDYLLTGAVKSNEVCSVDIGRKTEILKASSRTFLYPVSCNKQIPNELQKKCQGVKTVEQTWRLISGSGIGKIAESSSLENIGCLNLLVGGAFQPVLSVILQLNPNKIILWCSEETRTNGELIRDALNLIPEFQPEINIMMLDSHDLQFCYKTLRNKIKEQKPYENTLISITGGNRLMGIAAQLTAQELNIRLIYRDIDAVENELTIIQFGKKNNYESTDIFWNKCPFRDHIKWDYLYRKGGKTPVKYFSGEQLLENFYQNGCE